ncbi:MFS transporter [Bradyrhizobium sp. SZCCHNR2035]|uniref:MFS transporter n=1 Tax=Bradyrhizobium sp. SZCCHNR2035 TaxID=3057386 RepID=UPI002916BE78|nr:MFS transporter [Bradyrhizobium sp. SZCCHNR2035]
MTTLADPRETPLSAGLIVLLAVTAGGAIANNYAIQPSLDAIAQDIGTTPSAISMTVSGVMLGYLAGLALLVPLADHVNPRRLIPGQLLALAAALIAASMAPSVGLLLVCFILVGAMTTVAAQTSAIVGKLAAPAHRGRQMGLISAGISAGILLSRFVGGLLSTWVGWRAMLLCFAGACCVAALATALRLPASRPQPTKGYFFTLRSVPALLILFPQLRLSAAAGMLWFFAFSTIWVGLAISLAQPPWSLNADAIGLYSLVGLLGLFVTPVAGRFADRYGARRVKLAGLTAAAASALILLSSLGQPLASAPALAVFDAGCFAAQVANQADIVRLDPARSGVLNSAYLLLYYVAGAIGTAAAGALVTAGGWTLVASAAGAAIVGAIVASCFDFKPETRRS